MLSRCHRGLLAAGAAAASVSAVSALDSSPRRESWLPALRGGWHAGTGYLQCEGAPAAEGGEPAAASAAASSSRSFHRHNEEGHSERPATTSLLERAGLRNPGDFEDLEEAHTFRVQELDGVFLMLISMLGKLPPATEGGEVPPPQPQDREPAMFQLQYTLNASATDASFVLNDTRNPVR